MCAKGSERERDQQATQVGEGIGFTSAFPEIQSVLQLLSVSVSFAHSVPWQNTQPIHMVFRGNTLS